MTSTNNITLIVLAMAAATCASAQAQQATQQQTACYEIVMVQTGAGYPPLGSLRINKCTGETRELLAAPAPDNSGMSASRWFPITVETRERFLKQ